MPILKEVHTVQTVVCDRCGQRKELDKVKPYKQLIIFKFTEKDGLRLFEKKTKIKHYESFQIPNRKEVIFCSLDCAKKWIQHTTDLFLAEIKSDHHTISGLKRKQLN